MIFMLFFIKDTASFGDKALERYSTLLIDEKFKNRYLLDMGPGLSKKKITRKLF